MSRSSTAKKARRKRRREARNDAWLPDEVHADVRGVARIAAEIVPRGWVFDEDFSTDAFVTWYFEPSGTEVADESVEPVTRIWVTDPSTPHVILVGSGEDADDVALTVDELFARLPEFEAYRPGDPLPAVG
jgi:hypothetical protein